MGKASSPLEVQRQPDPLEEFVHEVFMEDADWRSIRALVDTDEEATALMEALENANDECP